MVLVSVFGIGYADLFSGICGIIVRNPNMGHYMKYYSFGGIKVLVPVVFCDEERYQSDTWFIIISAFKGFNSNRKKTVEALI